MGDLQLLAETRTGWRRDRQATPWSVGWVPLPFPLLGGIWLPNQRLAPQYTANNRDDTPKPAPIPPRRGTGSEGPQP